MCKTYRLIDQDRYRQAVSRESFLDNIEFMEIVRICVITRCTYKEALKMIREVGFQISEKTYQRAKNELKQTRKKRITQIADEFPEYAANTIDTALAVEYELWRILKTSKNTVERLKTLQMIMQNCKDKSELFEGSPALSEFAKKGDKKTESEKTSPSEAAEAAKTNGVNHDMEKDQEPSSS